MTRKKIARVFAYAAMAFCAAIICVLAMKLPMQEIKITAKTTAEQFDLSESTTIYHFGQIASGSHTARIQFVAVKDRSDNLFTWSGTGQYVYLGCKKLEAEYDFISFGRFLKVRLTMNAAQTDLKLEDGTPFDVTRYSLKPVLTIGDSKQ